LKESAVGGPLTRMEKSSRFPLTDDTGVQIIVYLYFLDFCYSN